VADDAGVIARQRLRAAMEARDHAAVVSLFAPGVVVYSPIIGRAAFRGRDSVADVYAAILEGFADFRYTREMEGWDGEQLLGFEGTLRGTPLQGVDIIRVDDEGLIAEMTVMIRPLAGLIAFLVEIGPLIARRRGRRHALALRLVGPPLPLVARLVEWLSPRLVNLGRR
jgi:hypothetical protein